MLFELSVNSGRVLTNSQLLQRVWGPDKTGGSGPVRNIIKRLRLNPNPPIHTGGRREDSGRV